MAETDLSLSLLFAGAASAAINAGEPERKAHITIIKLKDFIRNLHGLWV
jgi:hypothetical protein